MSRYYARSASDKTDDWPFWYVADIERGHLNVTSTLLRERDGTSGTSGTSDIDDLSLLPLIDKAFALLPFLEPWEAVQLAMWANRQIERQ